MTHRENHNNPERRRREVEELMMPPDGVEQKFDVVVDSVPPDKGCEVLDWELTHE